ncbi:MAG: hypothetical protein ACREJ4_03335, partial [Candidatus Methylomirabilaceae bacterium]
TVSGIEYSRLPSNELHILALDGSVVAVIQKDVQAYTWCCDGEQLAYIVGPYREGTPEFTPKGVYLYDLNSRRETELPVPHSVYRIQWAPFDSSLYFVRVAPGRDGKVLRYHLPTSRTSPSRYRDIVFSPSGKHYLFYSADDEERGPAWHLIERESGREFPIPDTSMGAVSGWAFGMGDRLLLARVRPVTTCPSGKRQELRECDAETIGYSIYEVLRSAVVLRIDGRIVREAAASDQSLVVTRGGRLEMVRDALR